MGVLLAVVVRTYEPQPDADSIVYLVWDRQGNPDYRKRIAWTESTVGAMQYAVVEHLGIPCLSVPHGNSKTATPFLTD